MLPDGSRLGFFSANGTITTNGRLGRISIEDIVATDVSVSVVESDFVAEGEVQIPLSPVRLDRIDASPNNLRIVVSDVLPTGIVEFKAVDEWNHWSIQVTDPENLLVESSFGIRGAGGASRAVSGVFAIVVPEPSRGVVLGFGGLLILAAKRRRQHV